MDITEFEHHVTSSANIARELNDVYNDSRKEFVREETVKAIKAINSEILYKAAAGQTSITMDTYGFLDVGVVSTVFFAKGFVAEIAGLGLAGSLTRVTISW